MSDASTVLRVGDRAPSFALSTQRGERRTLAEQLALGPVLLVFHRGTW